MAIVRIPEESRAFTDPSEVATYLAGIGIAYERWQLASTLDQQASPAQILAAYTAEVEDLQRRGGYTTVDVIDVDPGTPDLEAMLARFRREHWHDEDEVRFIVQGRGLFHVHPQVGPLTVIEVEPGDLIGVPRGTRHWFDLCGDRRIRAIRLFQETSGWTPHYTESGLDRDYQPVCLGPAYLPLSPASPRTAFGRS